MAENLRERIAQACRVLGRLELTRAATGHISARLPGTDRILIRARGPEEFGVRYTTENEVIEVDVDGRQVQQISSGLSVPLEVFIHTAIYRRRPDVNAVVHMHPAMVVLFTICGKPLLPLYGAYDLHSAQLSLRNIPTFPRSILINSPQLGAALAETLGDSPVCLMRGHGVTTAAAQIEEAALYVIYLNELAVMNYRAHLLGGATPISREDQEEALSALQSTSLQDHPQAARPQGLRSQAALWRYYCTLTGA